MNKLATPLRAENNGCNVIDATGRNVCICPDKETAALIVAMSEDAKRLRDALESIAALAEKFDDLKHIEQVAKAALAAGGNEK